MQIMMRPAKAVARTFDLYVRSRFMRSAADFAAASYSVLLGEATTWPAQPLPMNTSCEPGGGTSDSAGLSTA